MEILINTFSSHSACHPTITTVDCSACNKWIVPEYRNSFKLMLELGTRFQEIPLTTMLQFWGKCSRIIQFGFHFKHKYKFKSVHDFNFLNEIRYVWTKREPQIWSTSGRPASEPLNNITFNNMSSDPAALMEDEMTFRGRHNLETALIPFSFYIKVCERREMMVRGARYEASAVILTL